MVPCWSLIALTLVSTGGSRLTVKAVDRSPETFLGKSIRVEGWIGPEAKASELTVLPDPQARPSRLRFLCPKSLADQLVARPGVKRAIIGGTVSAPADARSGYSFDVETVTLFDANGVEGERLKPTMADNAESPAAVAEPIRPPETPRPKLVEGGKKSDSVPTYLIVAAGLMAAFIVTAAVIGVRLMKHLRKVPARRAVRS